jgi:hypothetical protein
MERQRTAKPIFIRMMGFDGQSSLRLLLDLSFKNIQLQFRNHNLTAILGGKIVSPSPSNPIMRLQMA